MLVTRNEHGRYVSPKPIDVREKKDVPILVNAIHTGPVMFVLIHADWCGPCQKFKPIWADIANTPGRRANIASVHYDMREKIPLLKDAKIDGYPSVLKVSPDGRMEEYNVADSETTTNAIPHMRNMDEMRKEVTDVPVLEANNGRNRNNHNSRNNRNNSNNHNNHNNHNSRNNRNNGNYRPSNTPMKLRNHLGTPMNVRNNATNDPTNVRNNLSTPMNVRQNSTNTPMNARNNATNDPTNVRNNATNDPTNVRQNATNDPTNVRNNATNDPTNNINTLLNNVAPVKQDSGAPGLQAGIQSEADSLMKSATIGTAQSGGGLSILGSLEAAIKLAGPAALLMFAHSMLPKSARNRTFKSPKRSSFRNSTRRNKRAP